MLLWKIVLAVGLVLGCSLKFCSCNSVCSKTVPVDSCSQCLSDKRDANQGLQLLIPAWNFTCQGTIEKWFAHVTVNDTVDSIEFQIYAPVADSDNYSLVYGNEYQGNSAEGSLISRSVDIINPLFIPIKPGYIVGVYLPPNNGNEQLLELMYNEQDEEGTDVYYWTGIQSRQCQYSLCSGKVKKGLNFLIGWDFTETSLGQLETVLAVSKDPSYCSDSVQECIALDVVSSSFQLQVPSSSPSITTATATSTNSIMHTLTDHSTSTSTTTTESSVIAVISASSSMTNVPPLGSSSPSSDSVGNSLGISSFQLGLLGGVLILLTIIITLLITLLIMFTKRKRKLTIAKTFEDPISCNGHVDTGVNPSYRQLTVPACESTKIPHNGHPSVGKCFELQTDTYTEIDPEFKETSRKDYSEVEMMKRQAAEDYCVPFSCTNRLFPDYEIMYARSDNKTRTEAARFEMPENNLKF